MHHDYTEVREQAEGAPYVVKLIELDFQRNFPTKGLFYFSNAPCPQWKQLLAFSKREHKLDNFFSCKCRLFYVSCIL